MAGQGPSVEDRLSALERQAAEGAGQTRLWRSRFRYTIVMAGLLALTVTGVSVGVTGEPLRLSQRTPATGNATAETSVASANGTGYTLRLTNNNGNGDGGGLGATCRSGVQNEPCVVGFNAAGGLAFQFAASGNTGGRITTAGGPNSVPFTTNATGVATGLNADKVDGKDASDLGVAGSGSFSGNCDSPTSCPITRNRNVTSVTRPQKGVYCIGVQGASASSQTIMAGLSGSPDFLGPSTTGYRVRAMNGSRILAPSSEDEICPSADHFQVYTEFLDPDQVSDGIPFWFAVLP